MVGGLVAAGATVTLAACAADTEPELAATTPPSATVDQAPEESSGEQLLGPASDVLVGSGKKYMVDSMLTILVTQPREGEYRAFNASCTHAGCIVNGVEDGQIGCGCHGAKFNAESGAAEAGPARSALGKITVELRGSDLYALI